MSFLNPARDGAVLPVLHLNGAKIAGPTVLGRKDPAEVRSLLEGHGYEVIEVEGEDLPGMHHRFADGAGPGLGRDPRDPGGRPRRRLGRHPAALAADRAAHPEGLDRAGRRRRRPGARAPGARTRCRCPGCKDNPAHLRLLEDWLRSYRPEELFDDDGAPTELVRRANPDG